MIRFEAVDDGKAVTIQNMDGQSRRELAVEKFANTDGDGKMSLSVTIINPHQRQSFVVGDGISYVIREQEKKNEFAAS